MHGQDFLSRPSYMRVDMGALEDNLASIRAHIGESKIMGIVKANAYGHGLLECGSFMTKCGVDYLGVAFVEEGVALRKSGIRLPILVLGGFLTHQVKEMLNYGLEIAVSSISKLLAVDQVAEQMKKKAHIHLKIDTGMERVGVHSYNSHKFFEAAVLAKNCKIVGVFSHFALAEEVDFSFTEIQLERFKQAIYFFERQSLPMPLRHIANSAALLRDSSMKLDMVRPGLILYGIYPNSQMAQSISLKPVMSLRSSVVYFKVVHAGSGISYGHKWRPAVDTRVVTVGIGYGDGIPRSLSGKGQVLVRGQKRRMVGAICMDQLMVDLGPAGEGYVGDEVILVGENDGEVITVNELADAVGTVPHEILTSINCRVPRRYVYRGEPYFIGQTTGSQRV